MQFQCLYFSPIILFNTCFEFSYFWVNVFTIVERKFNAHVFTVIISLNLKLHLNSLIYNTEYHPIRYLTYNCNGSKWKVIAKLKHVGIDFCLSLNYGLNDILCNSHLTCNAAIVDYFKR